MSIIHYGKYDHYWIIRQIWAGHLANSIAKAISSSSSNKILCTYRKYFFKEKKIHDYGISEIAKELGVSRQAVHQKVKACVKIHI